jgi:hypothetical protein
MSCSLAGAGAGLAVSVVLFAGVGMPPNAAAEQVGVINLPEVVKVHWAFLIAPGLDPHAPAGPDPNVVEAHQKRLRSLRERLGRERSRMDPEQKKSLEQEILAETETLQTLWAKVTRDVADKVRWRSRDVFFPHLAERIGEFAHERGLALIIDQVEGRPVYRDPALAGEISGERVELTESLIEWLRQKDGSPPDGTPAPANR